MRALAAFLSAVLAVLVFAGAALAQDEAKKSPFGLPMPPSADGSSTTAGEQSGPMTRAWLWVQGMQAKLNRDMSKAVKELKSAGSLHAAWVLSLIAFMYGVLHAAGPGHGKAVISSYVLANERTVRRGIFLSFLAALFQALAAIATVGVLAIALNATSLTIKATEHWIETVSWGLVAAVGAWMLYGQVKPLLARRAGSANEAGNTHTHSHDEHGHHTGSASVHDHTCCGGHHRNDHAHPAKPVDTQHESEQAHVSAPHHVHAHSGHDHTQCCGHAHMPSPKDLEGDLTWSKALAIAGSVGIRPCTGAIIVLIFALSQGILWAGVFATFAMALGTAITTSALAALAVGSKELATRFAGGDGSRWAGNIATAAGLTGSALVLALGLGFFLASLNGPAPL